ncbi:MAG: hypothetical protein AAGI38_11460, partial [Bacteroidota bacterium]
MGFLSDHSPPKITAKISSVFEAAILSVEKVHVGHVSLSNDQLNSEWHPVLNVSASVSHRLQQLFEFRFFEEGIEKEISQLLPPNTICSFRLVRGDHPQALILLLCQCKDQDFTCLAQSILSVCLDSILDGSFLSPSIDVSVLLHRSAHKAWASTHKITLGEAQKRYESMVKLSDMAYEAKEVQGRLLFHDKPPEFLGLDISFSQPVGIEDS